MDSSRDPKKPTPQTEEEEKLSRWQQRRASSASPNFDELTKMLGLDPSEEERSQQPFKFAGQLFHAALLEAESGKGLTSLILLYQQLFKESLLDIYDEAKSSAPFHLWLDSFIKKMPDDNKFKQAYLSGRFDLIFLNPKERLAYETKIEGGLIYIRVDHPHFVDEHKQSGKTKPWVLLECGEETQTKRQRHSNELIYVLAKDEENQKHLYVGRDQPGKFHHSSFTGGKSIITAGTLVARNGELVRISNDSGHYKPTSHNFDKMIAFLRGKRALDYIQEIDYFRHEKLTKRTLAVFAEIPLSYRAFDHLRGLIKKIEDKKLRKKSAAKLNLLALEESLGAEKKQEDQETENLFGQALAGAVDSSVVMDALRVLSLMTPASSSLSSANNDYQTSGMDNNATPPAQGDSYQANIDRDTPTPSPSSASSSANNDYQTSDMDNNATPTQSDPYQADLNQSDTTPKKKP